MTIFLIILSAANLLILAYIVMKFSSLGKDQGRIEYSVKDEIAKNRSETMQALGSNQKAILDQLLKITQINEDKLEKVRDVVDKNLKTMQEDNSRRLEKMRETVDEKLHSTLEKRLGESFKSVSERLEKVHQGLGEMQTLAHGVCDLKKV